jgi:replicative DNA helicase
MSMTGRDRPDNRTLEIAAITRSLKLMAREIDCPVLALSQTGRDYEKRSGRPMLSDLRDSGAIEQDADLIMFIHNKSEKELKDSTDDDDFEYNPEIHRMLLILKHRNGETGDVIMRWEGRYTKFSNVTTERMTPNSFGDSRVISDDDGDAGQTVAGAVDYGDDDEPTEEVERKKLPF